MMKRRGGKVTRPLGHGVKRKRLMPRKERMTAVIRLSRSRRHFSFLLHYLALGLAIDHCGLGSAFPAFSGNEGIKK